MHEFRVQDMTCSHCVAAITKAVKDVAPQASVDIDLDQHRVRVQGEADRAQVQAAIEAAGYSPEAVN